MIVVDTSVWIDYLNSVSTPQTETLDLLLGRDVLAIGDLILTEILQGLRPDAQFSRVKQVLLSFVVFEMFGVLRAIRCADRYRTLRKKGITIRRTVDVIIASYCIDEGHTLLFSDKDFIPFVEHFGLKTI
ncbi:MAG: PIN domain nuclease [Bacteroidetes bacterium]|nr:MAG: PIN domain nuclease [Bacteroidota bacterium]